MNWFLFFHFLIVSVCLNKASKFEEFVVDGKAIRITDAPYAAHLTILCPFASHTCGGTILTNLFLLTAAHCIPCFYDSTVIAHVGHSTYEKGKEIYASDIVIHEDYDDYEISSDIAIIVLNRILSFSDTIKKVAIYNKSNKATEGFVVGWGRMGDSKKSTLAMTLQGITQKIWTKKQCEAMLTVRTSAKTICGGELHQKKYIASGDSGSALVVKGYIQVGLVSYKNIAVSKSLAVYTDIHYFYNWIQKTAKRLYCDQVYEYAEPNSE